MATGPSTAQFFKCLSNLNKTARAPHLGLLERPNLPPDVDELRYKVLVTGHSGVGKTHFVSWLAGWELIDIHATTPGIQTTTVSCTCKKLIAPQKTYLFQLEMWEVGAKGKKILTGGDLRANCPENVDAIIILFSYGDHGSFDALPAIIQETKDQSKEPKPCFICVESGWSLEEPPAISMQEIGQFERLTLVPIIRIPLMKSTQSLGSNDWSVQREDVLAFICEQLWQRDHVIVERGFADDFQGTESPILI